jgi:hypothetical protein
MINTAKSIKTNNDIHRIFEACTKALTAKDLSPEAVMILKRLRVEMIGKLS